MQSLEFTVNSLTMKNETSVTFQRDKEITSFALTLPEGMFRGVRGGVCLSIGKAFIPFSSECIIQGNVTSRSEHIKKRARHLSNYM